MAREYRLTPQEREVVHGMAMGLSVKETAARMHISPATVKAYTRLVMVKMAVSTRAGILAKVVKRHAEESGGTGNDETQQYRAVASDRANRMVVSVIKRAKEVIGGQDEALRWLGTPVRALDYATPISLLGTSEGIRRVKDVLGRLEHGVW